MIIGIPKEVKINENRVSVTPPGAAELALRGHQVLVEKDAGLGSGFSDAEYRRAGAQVLDTAEKVWSAAGMIVKVKEPVAGEYVHFREELIIFTYLHLAANRILTEKLLETKVTGLAYETIRLADGSLPLLTPMSEIAGKIGAQEAAVLLAKQRGGKGVLMGGAAGVPPAKVVVLGGGVSGRAAAQVTLGLGAQVHIMDINLDVLRRISFELGAKCITSYSNQANIRTAISGADVVIGCVLVPGDESPKIVSREMLSLMEPGSVVVDIAIDQGGCFETSHPTTHQDPTYVVDGVIHYCVANMPGCMPRTSTLALSNATLPYIFKLAEMKSLDAIAEDAVLALGLNTCLGNLTCPPVGRAVGMPFMTVAEVFSVEP